MFRKLMCWASSFLYRRKVEEMNSHLFRPRFDILEDRLLLVADFDWQGTVDVDNDFFAAGSWAQAVVPSPGTGTMTFDSPGLFELDGDFSQVLSGLIEIEIEGVQPQVQHDILEVADFDSNGVGGNVTLGGTLDGVVNYSPQT